ncbi:alpha/beta-hydrolase family protein [Hoyosella subflava]|uniref:Integral membrane protein n=1 Tax=Hoyosella subflava (strain DSM 45089 / JCM 17490 / NBRC 109087 / DQS3-9A1) TaxID=443218 RepID=F6EED3_HOYSD|nr:alpha/beta-hydrolase family protein [Hoyosella subflava]AEF38585.1 hypothetical protein AS9A_0125 [Hoyosella subflava DQS3-9A1]
MAVAQLRHMTPAVSYPAEKISLGTLAWPIRDWFMLRAGMLSTSGIAVALSLTPGLLPRAAAMQAFVTGLFVLVALALRGGISWVLRRRGVTVPAAFRVVAAGLGVVVAAYAIWRNSEWQNALRSEMRMPEIGATYWAVFAGLAGAMIALAMLGVRLIARASRSPMKLVGTAVVVGAVVYLVALPAGGSMATRAVQPVSLDMPGQLANTPWVSGSVDSGVSWEELGSYGQRFVLGSGAAGASSGAVRVYAGMSAADSIQQRAALVVRELERTGGLMKSHLVLAFPTGSGWIDPAAARAIEDRFGDDVATAAMAYSTSPSWINYLFGRVEAEEAAAIFTSEVAARLQEMPRAERPRMYLYGLSMGSVAGAAALAALDHVGLEPCGVLWAGAPPAVDRTTTRTVVVENPSDPVAVWEPRLAVWPTERLDVWLPVVSYLQVSADLANSLAAGPGFGHRYGAEQGDLLPDCGPEHY